MFKNKDYKDNIKLLNTSINRSKKGYIWENNYKDFRKDLLNEKNLIKKYFGRGNWEINIDKINLKNYQKFIKENFKKFFNKEINLNNISLIAKKDQKKLQIDKDLKPEYLYKFFYSERIKFLYKKHNKKEIKTILEIGAGIGTLAKSFFINNKINKYVIIDIPETLILEKIYLEKSLNKRILIVKNKITKSDYENNDIILVSPDNIQCLKNIHFDILINTNSFGEFPLKFFLEYKKKLNNFKYIKNIYSLNRFFNRIRKEDSKIRFDHLGYLFNFPKNFLIKEFFIDPDFEKFDYSGYSIRSRNLELFLKIENTKKIKFEQKYFKKKYEQIVNEDFFLNKSWPRLNTRSDFLFEETSKNIAYIFFVYYHLSKKKIIIKHFLKYMINLGGIIYPFEEVYYLISRLNNDCKYSLINEKYKIFLNSNFNFKDYLADIPFFLSQKINSDILSGRESIKLFYDNLCINFILIKKVLKKLL